MKTTGESSKAMHISLWIAQTLMAIMFLMAGFMKATMPIESLIAMLPWANSVPAALVKFIGLSELLGGLGLLLPSLLRIKPQLTVWAAIGIATIMMLAIPLHLSRGENEALGMNITFIILSLFIAWGRTKKAPIAPKS